MATNTIFPILNSRLPHQFGPSWDLSPRHVVREIHPFDFGNLSKHHPAFAARMNASTLCIYVDKSEITDVHHQASICRYLLSDFKDASPPSIDFVFEAGEDHAITVSPEILEYTQEGAAQMPPFELRKNVEIETIKSFYSLLCAATRKRDVLALTFDRYCQSLTRSHFADRLTDLVVSLESVIGVQAELKFKFCLFGSLLAVPDAKQQERRSAFELLSRLYDTRSAVVHGRGGMKQSKYEKLLADTQSAWSEILRLAGLAITYQVFFLHSHEDGAWETHLRDLALGATSRVIGEKT